MVFRTAGDAHHILSKQCVWTLSVALQSARCSPHQIRTVRDACEWASARLRILHNLAGRLAAHRRISILSRISELLSPCAGRTVVLVFRARKILSRTAAFCADASIVELQSLEPDLKDFGCRFTACVGARLNAIFLEQILLALLLQAAPHLDAVEKQSVLTLQAVPCGAQLNDFCGAAAKRKQLPLVSRVKQITRRRLPAQPFCQQIECAAFLNTFLVSDVCEMRAVDHALSPLL